MNKAGYNTLRIDEASKDQRLGGRTVGFICPTRGDVAFWEV